MTQITGKSSKRLPIFFRISRQTKSSFQSMNLDHLQSKFTAVEALSKLVRLKASHSSRPIKGSLTVTAALEMSENQVTHLYSKRKNTKEMLKLLDVLLEKYAGQSCIYFSWDAASWHASKKLYERVDEIDSVEYQAIHHTPIV